MGQVVYNVPRLHVLYVLQLLVMFSIIHQQIQDVFCVARLSIAPHVLMDLNVYLVQLGLIKILLYYILHVNLARTFLIAIIVPILGVLFIAQNVLLVIIIIVQNPIINVFHVPLSQIAILVRMGLNAKYVSLIGILISPIKIKLVCHVISFQTVICALMDLFVQNV